MLRSITSRREWSVSGSTAERSPVSRGARDLVLAQGAKFVLQFGSLAILSRILSPAEFGVVAMATAIVALGEVVRDAGISTATIQASELPTALRSNLFWLSVAIGGVLSAALFVAAPVVGRIYANEAVVDVVRVLSCVFIIASLGAQYRASLVRGLRFRPVAVADGMAYGVGALVAVLAALWGAGVWALVVQQIVIAIVTSAALAIASAWLPGRPRRHVGTRPILRVGWNILLTQAIGSLSRNADALVIGRYFGASALGYYNRGFQLMMLPMSQISGPATSVALPVLSRAREEPERLRKLAERAQSAFLVPLFVGIGLIVVLAPLIVQILLGDGWDRASDIVRILGLGAAFQGASYLSYWLFVSTGQTGLHFRLTLATRPVLVCALLVGAAFGMDGVAWAYSLSTGGIWVASLYALRATPGLRVGVFFRNAALLLFVHVGAVVIALVVGGQSSSLVTSAVLGGSAYALAIIVGYLLVRDCRLAAVVAIEFIRSSISKIG